MALQTLVLDPAAAPDTGDQIITKINAATAAITRADSVSAAARPIGSAEVASANLAAGVAKANLDAMADTARGYVKTSPTAGQFKVVAVQRQTDGKLAVTYDDVAV